MEEQEELQKSLMQTFGIDFSEKVSKEKLISALAFRVNQLLEANAEQLFSLLYRLDISERRIKTALLNAESFPVEIACLIYERQMEKINSRKNNISPKPDDDLAW